MRNMPHHARLQDDIKLLYFGVADSMGLKASWECRTRTGIMLGSDPFCVEALAGTLPSFGGTTSVFGPSAAV